MEYRQVLMLIENKAKKYEEDTLPYQELRKAIETFEANVVVVGAFSAGKTALLNMFLGDEILREGQRPETAIASELIYDTSDYVEAFSNGSAQMIRCDEALSLDATQYDYLRWHLRNESLAGIQGYTLVDMPGFNSNIKAHNNAILRYAEKASAYLLVIDVEDGGIKQSLRDFVNEIHNYEHNLAILVSKCDLKSQETAAQVVESIRSSAEMLFGEKISVTPISKFDSEGAEKLETVIRQFQRETLCRQFFEPKIKQDGLSLIRVLELRKRSCRLDVSEIQAEIEQRERQKKALEQALRNKRGELTEQYGYEALQNVTQQVKLALSNEAPSLASSLRSGEQVFNAKVNAILRPVLVQSVQQFADQSFDEIVKLVGDISSSEGSSAKEDGEKRLMLYRAATGALALTTTVVAPWLEILIILLPDILRFLTSIIKNAPQTELETKVRDEVIPQIVSKLQPDIQRSLAEVQNTILEELEESYNSQIDMEIRTLDTLKEQERNRRDAHEQEIADIEADLQELQSAVDSLQG